MRLSEAIRLGALLKPQAFEKLFDGHGTCAIGSAMDACGDALSAYFCNAIQDEIIHQRWPVLGQAGVRCPACWAGQYVEHGSSDNVLCNITTLNDRHYWTREQIAEWVATLEPQPVEQPQPDLVAVTRD